MPARSRPMQPPATRPSIARTSFAPWKSLISGAGGFASAQWKLFPSAARTQLGLVSAKIAAPAGIPAATWAVVTELGESERKGPGVARGDVDAPPGEGAPAEKDRISSMDLHRTNVAGV